MSTEATQIDVQTTPPPVMPDSAAAPSPALETSPAPEAVAGSVPTGEGADEAQPVADPFEGIPSIEELTKQAEQKVPYSEGLLRLRTELERIKPDAELATKWKPLGEVAEPEDLRSAYEQRQKLFSPVVNPETNQPEYDERGLQKRTSHPWIEANEQETPGFYQRHLDDMLQYVDPKTGLNGAQMYFKGIGLDINRFDDYLNIDSLLAKSNGGAITPAELELVPETDREAYKTLPSSLRGAWKDIPEDEQRFHLDGAKERIEARQWREQQEQVQKQTEETQRQQFQAKLQHDVISDLSNVRKEGLTSLRDSLSKAVQLSSDPAVNGAYIDAIIAPLALLLSPDFHDLGGHMLESMGVKLDGAFNDALQAFVTARQEHVIAKAYGDQAAAQMALKEADGKFARIMARFNDLALKRAATFGYQAKQIATANGNALAAASARPVAGNGSAVEAAQGILPQGMDPYSPEASMYLYNQTRARGN